jgi:hypothetical protein
VISSALASLFCNPLVPGLRPQAETRINRHANDYGAAGALVPKGEEKAFTYIWRFGWRRDGRSTFFKAATSANVISFAAHPYFQAHVEVCSRRACEACVIVVSASSCQPAKLYFVCALVLVHMRASFVLTAVVGLLALG